jgi:nicotinate phosphoribosyltransferase
MSVNQTNKTMLTDLYQLTMGAGYFDNKRDGIATFDLFVRSLPKDWGYYVANGVEDAIDYLTDIRFEDSDIDYLRSLGRFAPEFLDSLRTFRFEGAAYAVKEGTPIFPGEPILRITAPLEQAQFVETALLNTVNFQTMIATKASRVVNAARGAKVVDFGLRRAQEEDAAMKGARACYLAGCVGTSNVLAGKEYGIPLSGTMAHSFVMSFNGELDAFRAYVRTFPDHPVLLIDTYETLAGARNAATVAKELEKGGHQLGAVRLDSGNLADLSKGVRKILDEEELEYVKILASNDLNEYKIDSLVRDGAPITSYGVGTEMITGKPVAAIPGVYKLVEDEQGAKIKLSSGKSTLPGRKQVYRQTGADGKFCGDILALEGELVEGTPLLELAVRDGKRVGARPALQESRNYCLEQIKHLPDTLLKVKAEETYGVTLSSGLSALVEKLTEKYGGRTT